VHASRDLPGQLDLLLGAEAQAEEAVGAWRARSTLPLRTASRSAACSRLTIAAGFGRLDRLQHRQRLVRSLFFSRKEASSKRRVASPAASAPAAFRFGQRLLLLLVPHDR